MHMQAILNHLELGASNASHMPCLHIFCEGESLSLYIYIFFFAFIILT